MYAACENVEQLTKKKLLTHQLDNIGTFFLISEYAFRIFVSIKIYKNIM